MPQATISAYLTIIDIAMAEDEHNPQRPQTLSHKPQEANFDAVQRGMAKF